MYLSVGELASILGISVVTLRRWDRDNYLTPDYRTRGGHRRYFLKRILEYFGLSDSPEDKINILYARVSSHDQKDDLGRQEEKLSRYAAGNGIENISLISDLGSGINYKKKGLKKLIGLIISGVVDKVYVTHKDRLLRFGFGLIETIASYFGTRIVTLDSKEEDFGISLSKDVLEIITVFSAKLYGRRAHVKKSHANLK